MNMPHDFKKTKLAKGDLVSMLFEITNLSEGEDDCNVSLQALNISGVEQAYLPHVACNSKLVRLELK